MLCRDIGITWWSCFAFPAEKQLTVLPFNILPLQSLFGFQNIEQNQVDLVSWFSQTGKLRHAAEEWLHLPRFPQAPSPSRNCFCCQTATELQKSHSCLTPPLIFLFCFFFVFSSFFFVPPKNSRLQCSSCRCGQGLFPKGHGRGEGQQPYWLLEGCGSALTTLVLASWPYASVVKPSVYCGISPSGCLPILFCLCKCSLKQLFPSTEFVY